MLVYHVSRYEKESRVKEFVPRIPWSGADDEDTDTPRVCVSSSLIGALTAVILSEDIIDNGEAFMVYSANVDEEEMIPPEKLVADYGVFDAMCTQEYWVTKPITMIGNLYRIKRYERGNYLMPFPECEERVRRYLNEYNTQIPLHELLNESGIDEDELVDECGVRGIRVFTKIELEAV